MVVQIPFFTTPPHGLGVSHSELEFDIFSIGKRATETGTEWSY